MKPYKKIMRKAEKKAAWGSMVGANVNRFGMHSYSDANCGRHSHPSTVSADGYLEQKEEESRINALRGTYYEEGIEKLKTMMDFYIKKTLRRFDKVSRSYAKQNRKIRKLRKRMFCCREDIAELKEVIRLMSYCAGASGIDGDWAKLLKQWQKAADKRARINRKKLSVDYCSSVSGKEKDW